MERDIDDQRAWSRLLGQWQPAVLVTACLACGLTLTTMVIGSTPNVVVRASEAAIEETPVDTISVPSVTEVPVDTASSTDVAEIVVPAVAEAASTPGASSAASLEAATVAPAAAPAAPSPAPTAAPVAPSPPAPSPVVTTSPAAPVTVAAPQTTAVPTTAAPSPAPTTAAPTPTTVAPATALTYPSFSAGAAATVVLQFDGSSISVASVTRQPNWVSQIDKNGPRTVEIKFFNTATGRDEEFHATVEGGRIEVEN